MSFGSLLVSLLLLSLDVDASVAHRFLGGQCVDEGLTYNHGQVFTRDGYSNCIKHRCNDGNVVLHEEGCRYLSGCRPLGSIYTSRCTTSNCTKTPPNIYGYTYYKTVITTTRCQDYYGECHETGSLFDHAIHGQLYGNCTCTEIEPGFVVYGC